MTKYFAFIALALLMISASVEASGGHDRYYRGRGNGHHRHHHHHGHHHGHDHYYGRRYRPVERVYYREEVVRYAPPPVYYQRPYPVQRYDYRSTEGRIGAAFGGVIGYELGRGDPLATGIGAAVGSFVGNEIRR